MENVQLAFIFALVTAVFTASFQILVRKGREYGNALTGALIGIFVNLPILILVSFITWEPEWLNLKAIGYFITTGIFGTGLGRFFLFMSLHKIGVAITSPLLSSIPLFSAVFAFELLGERPNIYIWIATISVFIGCLVITLKREQFPDWKPRYLWLPFFTILSLSIANIFRKMSLNVLPEPIFGGTVTYASAMLTLLVLSFFLPKNIRPVFSSKKAWIAYGLCGLVNLMAFVCRWMATNYGDVTIVVPLFASSSFFALFLSSVFLRKIEQVTIWSYIGTILIVLGIVLIGVSSF
tara:strand:- start:2874 stop:3755 length:882 start_codon:yes stop_codon:yes gene_type:complete